MREVGKGDDARAPDPCRLAQHDLGIAQMLQGVDLKHHIKGGVIKHGQALVQVELNHVDTALHAGQHVGVVDLDAIAGAAAVITQPGQQGTIAATQIKHAGALGHEAANGLQGGLVAHAGATSVSKKLRTNAR